MGFNLSKAEIAAIDKKLSNPNTEVLCPRCGGKLLFTEYGNSAEVKCETKNCIKGTVRGL